MEPKCFVDQTYKRNPKSDVYSYGVILWEISSGRKPFQRFKSREAIAIQIFSGNREKPVEGTPSEYIELYTQCWDGVPDKRPEMKTALSIINQLEQKYSNKNISRSLKGLLDIAIFDNHINYHDYNEFSDITKIDEDEFGSVYKSVWNKNDGLTIVLKCLKVKEDYLNEWIVQNFANKLHILQNNCVQENIIKFYGVTKDPDGYYNTIFQYAEEAEGLKFLHKNNIAHCDLNSNSIVVHKGKVIVAGFGISEQMNEVSLSRSIARKLQAYIEPQCFKEPSYKRDLRSDVYSFGVILWEISSGRPPFNGLEGFSITIHIFKGNRETPIVDTPPKYVEIYTQCWDEDPVKRPTMPAVLDILNGLII
ncbi:kinase-like protein [Gigaspora margarita]|uniref:Kinase-like protein n=1 Tax=Gigaspora margarita TaxID=4874 RepID=A0A8H4AJ68_GIGMA|nr:kinase-like protein [Gigaspora margarita]